MQKKLFALLFIFFAVSVVGQTPKEYSNGQGSKITLPLGDISFADKVISFVPGNPPPSPLNADPKTALGIPDFNQAEVTGFVSLGIGGQLVLGFTNNALVNIDGPDLYVFEVGKHIENTYLYVSKNAKSWKCVGKIGGGSALVDIGDSTAAGEIFSYVKLVDAKSSVKSNDRMWPGADIDAVAAIGSAKQVSLNSLYLFNTGESKIKPSAKKELEGVISELKNNPGYNLVIQGHTDSIGNKTANQKLSEERANAIKNYFVTAMPALKSQVKAFGYADDIPVASNATNEGREKNRRVEVFFIPVKKK